MTKSNMPEPQFGNKGEVYTAIFTGTHAQEVHDFALAFARAACNSDGKAPRKLRERLEKNTVMTAAQLSAIICEIQKTIKAGHNRFVDVNRSGNGPWVFIWYCYPYPKTDNDDPKLPKKPLHTVIYLSVSSSKLQLNIFGGRKTSIIRRAAAAMGRRVPLAWMTAKGIAQHPTVESVL